MLKSIIIALSLTIILSTSSFAGEWGKGTSYQGRNYQFGHQRLHGPHNAPGVNANRMVKITRPPAYCFNCGTISNRAGTVFREVPPTHRRQNMNTNYRTFFRGRTPGPAAGIPYGLGVIGIVPAYNWWYDEWSGNAGQRRRGGCPPGHICEQF